MNLHHGASFEKLELVLAVALRHGIDIIVLTETRDVSEFQLPAKLKNEYVVRWTEHPVPEGDWTRAYGGVLVACAKSVTSKF